MSGTATPRAYVSDIPITRPTLGHAVLSEWTKVKSVRSTVLAVAATAAVTIGLGLIVAANTTQENFEGEPFTLPALFGIMLGQLGVLTLGVLMVASEHGTGLIRTTFTAAPERYRVLTAKYLVFAALAFAVTLASVTLVTLVTMVLHSGPTAGPHSFGHALRSLLGGSVYVTLLGVLALAVGALLRHSVGAVATMIGLVTIPAIVPSIFMAWDSTVEISRVLVSYSAPVGLAAVFGLPTDEVTPAGLPQLLVLVLVTAAAVAASYKLVGSRDV
ncbi:ABC transporter permease [Streptomyces sp. NPDC089919]|uniref:ABC transporter permease n=1 Tax=Streptomyces sp. NPDC089919 TaxID=3155188 RepID=UPI00342F1C22